MEASQLLRVFGQKIKHGGEKFHVDKTISHRIMELHVPHDGKGEVIFTKENKHGFSIQIKVVGAGFGGGMTKTIRKKTTIPCGKNQSWCLVVPMHIRTSFYEDGTTSTTVIGIDKDAMGIEDLGDTSAPVSSIPKAGTFRLEKKLQQDLRKHTGEDIKMEETVESEKSFDLAISVESVEYQSKATTSIQGLVKTIFTRTLHYPAGFNHIPCFNREDLKHSSLPVKWAWVS